MQAESGDGRTRARRGCRHRLYGRARLDAVEQEKLDLYQQHYEEYTRIAKGLQALIRR